MAVYPFIRHYRPVSLLLYVTISKTHRYKISGVKIYGCIVKNSKVKLQLHYAIYRLRFYSNSLIHILSLSNSHNNVASVQKNRADKSHRVIVALDRGWGALRVPLTFEGTKRPGPYQLAK